MAKSLKSEDQPRKNVRQVWSCKIGFINAADLRRGSDAPMRDAVDEAFTLLAGREPHFILSGWNADLSPGELHAIAGTVPSTGESAHFEVERLKSMGLLEEVLLIGLRGRSS